MRAEIKDPFGGLFGRFFLLSCLTTCAWYETQICFKTFTNTHTHKNTLLPTNGKRRSDVDVRRGRAGFFFHFSLFPLAHEEANGKSLRTQPTHTHTRERWVLQQLFRRKHFSTGHFISTRDNEKHTSCVHRIPLIYTFCCSFATATNTDATANGTNPLVFLAAVENSVSEKSNWTVLLLSSFLVFSLQQTLLDRLAAELFSNTVLHGSRRT